MAIIYIALVIAALLVLFKVGQSRFEKSAKDKRVMRSRLNENREVTCYKCGYISVVPRGSDLHWCENIHKPCNKIVYQGGYVVRDPLTVKQRR